MVRDYVNTITAEGERKRRREDWYKNRHRVQNWFYEHSWCPPFLGYKYFIKLSRHEEIAQLRYFLSAFNVDIDSDNSQSIFSHSLRLWRNNGLYFRSSRHWRG